MLSDLKYAFRQIGKSPGFFLVAIFTLALGIGANTAIFSLVDAAFLKKLPARNPDQLVLLSWNTAQWPAHVSQTGDDARFSFSYPAFEQFKKANATLSDVFAFVPLGFVPQNTTVSVDGDPTTANSLMVTGDYFPGLGVNPVLGRAITEQDEASGAPRVAVISYAYWNRRFNRDPATVGRTVTLNDTPFTIVGVTPAGFHGILPFAEVDPDIWMAFADRPNLRPWSIPPNGKSVFTAGNWACLNIAGRLSPGVKPAEAEASLDVVFRNFLTRDWKPSSPNRVTHLKLVRAGRGQAGTTDQTLPVLATLMSAVGLLLLVACGNIALLLLARAGERQREMSIRLAMGAPRWRIARQLLTESLLLAVIGGAVGLFFAKAGMQILIGMLSHGRGPLAFDVGIDATTLLFISGVSLGTGILFGIAPAFGGSRLEPASAMKVSTGTASQGWTARWLGKAMVISQVAASLVLVVAAGLFVQTLQQMGKRNLGFNRAHVLVFGLDPTRRGYQAGRLANFYSQLQHTLQNSPGVRAATLFGTLPFGGSNNSSFSIEGSSRKIANNTVRWGTVGPSFCATLQIPLMLGRDIREGDMAATTKVAIVNEMFVQRFLPDENPIGQRLLGPGDGRTPYEIVGVVRDAELMDMYAKPMPKAFVPYTQPGGLSAMYFQVRTQGEPSLSVSEMREAVRQVDPNLPLLEVSTLSDLADLALMRERLLARLSGFFGFAALALACVGLYGMMAYSVVRRTKEIGIRMALGANPNAMLRMILSHGLRLALAGIAIGSAASLAVSHAIRGLLYGVGANDPATLVFAILVMIGVAVLASFLPAQRATKVDPMIALRAE